MTTNTHKAIGPHLSFSFCSPTKRSGLVRDLMILLKNIAYMLGTFGLGLPKTQHLFLEV